MTAREYQSCFHRDESSAAATRASTSPGGNVSGIKPDGSIESDPEEDEANLLFQFE
jgi:hypothetical protein